MANETAKAKDSVSVSVVDEAKGTSEPNKEEPEIPVEIEMSPVVLGEWGFSVNDPNFCLPEPPPIR